MSRSDSDSEVVDQIVPGCSLNGRKLGAPRACTSTGITHHSCATAFTATIRTRYGRSAPAPTPPQSRS